MMADVDTIPSPVADDVVHTGSFFHYYDNHPTEEDLMGESTAQAKLTIYLIKVLEWLYRAENWFVTHNLNIYRLKQRMEYPLAPDVAVFKGVVITDPSVRDLRSWRLYEPNRTPPQVVFELASEETWEADLQEKPAKYAAMRVREYFAYDPNQPPYWPDKMGRLRGWQLVGGEMIELERDGRGWLWSEQLESWLVPDGAILRLYDRDGQMRLTGEQAERAAKEEQRRLAQEQRRLAQEQQRRADEERRLAEAAQRRADDEHRRADEAEQRIAELQAELARLRQDRSGEA